MLPDYPPEPIASQHEFSKNIESKQLTSTGEILWHLSERWPNCFGLMRPLKNGIHNDIIAALGDAVSEADLSAALRVYVSSEWYLRTVARRRTRFNLDGHPVEPVTDVQRAYAQERLSALLETRRLERKGRARR